MKPNNLILSLTLLTLIGCTPPGPAPPEVTAFYPSSDTLPENLLRMYVTFSMPMKVVGNVDKVKLYDASGNEVEGALLDTPHELWSPDQTQWTLLLDPARVKTGLQAHEQMGRALVAGERIDLVVEGLEDVKHRRMEQPFVKTLHVVEADTIPPDTSLWVTDFPERDTHTPLEVSFPDRLDQFSLMQRLIVTTLEGQPVEGRVDISEQETQWAFKPDKQWQAGNYLLHVNTRLADPSGNNLNGLFDHKVGSLKYSREGEILTLRVVIH